MKHNNQPNTLENELSEHSWEVLTQMWWGRQATSSVDVVGDEISPDLKTEADQFFQKNDAKMLAIIHRCLKEKRRKRFFEITLPAFARIAAVWVAISSILFGLTIVSSAAVRGYLAGLMVRWTEKSVEMNIVPNIDQNTKPDGWSGHYYPSLVPSGLELSSVESTNKSYYELTYTLPNDSQWQLIYGEYADASMTVDAENAAVKTVSVLGHEATMLVKKEIITIYWCDEHLLYLMSIRNATEEEALQYANALKKSF